MGMERAQCKKGGRSVENWSALPEGFLGLKYNRTLQTPTISIMLALSVCISQSRSLALPFATLHPRLPISTSSPSKSNASRVASARHTTKQPPFSSPNFQATLVLPSRPPVPHSLKTSQPGRSDIHNDFRRLCKSPSLCSLCRDSCMTCRICVPRSAPRLCIRASFSICDPRTDLLMKTIFMLSLVSSSPSDET